MKNKRRVYEITSTALLCAIGILIPIVSPVKIIIEPASFTLASHVAIFIAMFISPYSAAAVALGTTLGFLLYGFPIIIVFRAASHLIFSVLGALVIKKRPEILESIPQSIVFAFAVAIVHAATEVLVVTPFYLNGNSSDYMRLVLLLVGVGTVVHSLVDFVLAYLIWRPIRKIYRAPSTPDKV